MGRDA